MSDTVSIADLMAHSGVKFGTSGARGTVDAMTDRVCYAYTTAFLDHLAALGEFASGGSVAVGGDRRPSTPRIARAVASAVADRGGRVVNCGRLPSPALALYGFTRSIPSVMVTGSHIPADRNGIKYARPGGEILKNDETAVTAKSVELLPGRFSAAGALVQGADLPPETDAATTLYLDRYRQGLPLGFLGGRRIGVYEHSAVGRDLFRTLLEEFGAEVIPLGRSETFVPVDTEAIRPEDVDLAHRWAAEHRLDALVSADGDSDRPLVADENGCWLRGDVAGVWVARELGARSVATPVSCNTVVERCGWFDQVRRTRIGSPYVIAAMNEAVAEGRGPVVGYEANGGFLTATPVRVPMGGDLAPLPTRDAVVVILTILLAAVRREVSVGELLAELPPRVTISGRLERFPTDVSAARLLALTRGGARALETLFGPLCGRVVAINTTDGLRSTWSSGEILHLRPSGNAPEFRCYVEADSGTRAGDLLQACLDIMGGWRP